VTGSGSTSSQGTTPEPPSYQNYLFGRGAKDITRASECSIVRGSTLRVEANRGYNPLGVQPDVEQLSATPVLCYPGDSPQTQDFWGGNTALNLKTDTLTPAEAERLSRAEKPEDYAGLESKISTQFELQNNKYRDFIYSAFDLQGQKELAAQSPLTGASPLDCEKENFLADPYTVQTAEEF
jgi:hypothetical protein